MYTSLRVRREDKAALERLQRRWQRARGEQPSQVELFERLVRFAERHGDLFMDDETPAPWTERQIQAWVADLPEPSPAAASWPSEIDEVVYGDPHGARRRGPGA